MGEGREIFLLLVLPSFFAFSLILEGWLKRKKGEGGKIELVLGNLFLVLIGMGILLLFR